MRTGRPARPWWVAPGVGALLGAVVIAVAAQGSLAGARVAMPGGPRLSYAAGAPRSTTATTVPAGDSVIVAPVHPVVTQSDTAAPTPGASSAQAPSHPSSSTGGAGVAATPLPTEPADIGAPASESPPPGPSTSSGDPSAGPTATSAPPTTTTTTRPPAATTTTTTDPSDDGTGSGDR